MIQILKQTKKVSKFKYLETEVSSMWELRTKIVPVTTGPSGTIKRRSGTFSCCQVTRQP
jgi:hypothetical protein